MQNDCNRNNFTDREGASELKTRIEDYWRQRGFEVQVILIEAGFSAALRATRFDICSDLVNGWPRRMVRVTNRDEPPRP